METTFARLSRAFRALAALERLGGIERVTFGETPTITINARLFREHFPGVRPRRCGDRDCYTALVFGIAVTAWEAAEAEGAER